jgi:hypothetical protein
MINLKPIKALAIIKKTKNKINHLDIFGLSDDPKVDKDTEYAIVVEIIPITNNRNDKKKHNRKTKK